VVGGVLLPDLRRRVEIARRLLDWEVVCLRPLNRQIMVLVRCFEGVLGLGL